MKHLRQDSQSPGRVLNLGPQEHEADSKVSSDPCSEHTSSSSLSLSLPVVLIIKVGLNSFIIFSILIQNHASNENLIPVERILPLFFRVEISSMLLQRSF